MTQMAHTGRAICVVLAISALATGWLFDRMLRTGANRTTLSNMFLATGYIGSSACIAGIVLAPALWAITFRYFNEIFHGRFAPLVWSTSQSITAPSAVRQWMGIQLTVGNIAGIIAPVVTGIAIHWSGLLRSDS
jgi:hypothetical protein